MIQKANYQKTKKGYQQKMTKTTRVSFFYFKAENFRPQIKNNNARSWSGKQVTREQHFLL